MAQTPAMVGTLLGRRNLPRLLLEAREAVMAHYRPPLRQNGLSDQQWRVLRVLAELGCTDTGHIARGAYIQGPSLSGVLARMERDGLIRRQRDRDDRRRTVVQATPEGKKLAAKLSASIESHYRWLGHAYGEESLATLYRLLDQLIAVQERK